MNTHPTIVITGGHVTPAAATIEVLQEKYPAYRLVYVGRNTALEGSGVPSQERRIIQDLGIPFLPLVTGRLQRTLTIVSFWSLLKVPIGFFHAFIILIGLHPTIIVSFGGYIALPVVVWGWLLRIPIITHEQTRVAGLTNKIISRFARKIAISFPDMTHEFAPEKTVYTGLPLRSIVFTPPQRCSIPIEKHLPIFLITGGSTGAQSLNKLVYPIVGQLTNRFMIVHQVGALSFKDASQVRATLPADQQRRYQIASYIDAPDYAWLVKRASLVLSRAGANTVGELALLGKVALVVPLPWSAGNEQYKNAQLLAEAGSAVVLEQKRLRPETLRRNVERVWKYRDVFEDHAHAMARHIPRDGALRLVREIASIVTEHAIG